MRDLSAVSTEQLVKFYDTLDTDKATAKQVFQEVCDYILPSKSNVTRLQVTAGERRGTERYDDTAVDANELLAASMAGTITSSAFQWFKPRLREEELSEDQEVREWLDICGSRMYDALNASNFNTQIHECYLDLGGYGTTALTTMEKPPTVDGSFGGFMFQNWPIHEYVFAENEEGIADTIFRKFKLRAYEIQQWFPREDLGPSINQAMTSGNADKQMEQYDILHCVYPRFARDPRRPDARNMPYASKYLAIKDKHVIRERGFQELPTAIARWVKSSDDRGWGRSPGQKALPTIRTLNTGRKLMLKAWAKDVSPALIAEHKGVVGQVRTYADGITYVRKNARFEYLKSGASWDASQYNEKELRQQIRASFFADQLIPPTEVDMTAAEFLKRVEMMQRLLGPVLGRIQTELLNPTLYRVFHVMLRAEAFPPVPQALLDSAQDANLDMEYVGPLARAQKLEDVAAIERIYQRAGAVAQLNGNIGVFDNLNDDAAIEIAGKLDGVPAKVLRGKEDREKLRKARASQSADTADLDTAEQASVIAKNLKVANG